MTTRRRYALRDHKLRAVRVPKEPQALEEIIIEVRAEQLRHRATRKAREMRAEESGR